MASYGKCINFGLCSKADSREAIAAGDGDLSCPECGKPLTPASGKGGGGSSASSGGGFPVKKAGIAAAAVLVLLGGTFFLLPSDETAAEDPTVVDNPPDPEPLPQPQPQPVIKEPEPPPPPVIQEPQPQPQPRPRPQPRTEPEPKPEPQPATYSGPSSGTLVWEGNVEEKEALVTIENGEADKGQVSGTLPGGVPVVLTLKDTKNAAIAMSPQPTSQYKRLVLRVKGKGKRRIAVDWSVAQ